MDSALVIIAGGTKFKLIVGISDDTEVNQYVAKKLARRILEKG